MFPICPLSYEELRTSRLHFLASLQGPGGPPLPERGSLSQPGVETTVGGARNSPRPLSRQESLSELCPRPQRQGIGRPAWIQKVGRRQDHHHHGVYRPAPSVSPLPHQTVSMEKSPYAKHCDQDFGTDPLPAPAELMKVKSALRRTLSPVYAQNKTKPSLPRGPKPRVHVFPGNSENTVGEPLRTGDRRRTQQRQTLGKLKA